MCDCSILKLVTKIPVDHLEFYNIHRALITRNLEGPSCDTFVCFHYVCTKGQLLQAAKDSQVLEFQGYSYQLFEDLSPATIFKWQEFKFILQILQSHQICYL